jgi:crotonobetainyl-CoA:carnitine CoA-transferase CaiB-like acyl-CoA transferase
MVREIHDPAFGGPILQPGIVPHFGGAAAPIRWPGPDVGAHNREVFEELLGFDPEELAHLREDGVI